MARNQFEAAQDERAHEDLAQLSVGLNQREQLLAIELNHFARLADTQAYECAATADHVGFAGELPGMKAHDQRLAAVRRSNGLELAADDDKDRHGLVADLDEHVATRRRATPSVGRNPRHLFWCERRKHALRTRDGDREGRQRGITRVHRASHGPSLAREPQTPNACIRTPDTGPSSSFTTPSLCQGHGVGTGWKAELPGHVVRGAIHRLRHVGLGRRRRDLRKRRENGLCEGRVCFGKEPFHA